MPGHASSPYWTAVDFDSEGEEEGSPGSSQRVYVDPWDADGYGYGRVEAGDSSQGENMNSFAGEPVSASFYYVPTKSFDAEEDGTSDRNAAMPTELIPPDYPNHNMRRRSRAVMHELPPEMPYGYMPIQPCYGVPAAVAREAERRRSMYAEEQCYAQHPIMYDPYAPLSPRPRAVLPPPPHPAAVDYAMAMANGKQRRHSRYVDAYERYAYEAAAAPEYEDWPRPPLPKAAPDNFHLSRYGHLQIDYSCSWNSLDRLIRNQ